MNSHSEQAVQLLKILEQHREGSWSQKDVEAFEAFVEEKGWIITDGFKGFLRDFGGIEVIRQSRSNDIHLLSRHLYEYRDFSQVWQETQGEYLTPVGYSDLTRYYVSEQGKIYGDIRDVDIVEVYGDDMYECMNNIINNRYLDSIEFYFDESRFD